MVISENCIGLLYRIDIDKVGQTLKWFVMFTDDERMIGRSMNTKEPDFEPCCSTDVDESDLQNASIQ